MSFELISLEMIQNLAHEYGYGAVFLGILLENMGIPLPGETITIVGASVVFWRAAANSTTGIAVVGLVRT